MSIEDLLGQIEDILEEGKRSLVGDKVRVDAEAIRSIIADIKISMPDEVIQARKIAAERKVILAFVKSSMLCGRICEFFIAGCSRTQDKSG